MAKHSRQSIFACIFVVISALSGSQLSLVFSITAVSEVPESKMGCNNLCGDTTIPYPFYLKPCDDTNNEFGLIYYNNSTLMITLDKVSYTMTSIDPDGIIINPNQTSCEINLQNFSIDGAECYAISTSNIIQFSGCENSGNITSAYNIPYRENNEQCKFVDTCCYFLENDILWQPGDPDFTQLSQNQCTGFTSWPFATIFPIYHVENGLKLEWAIPGSCTTVRCDVNALCSNATYVKGGVRCACKDSYIGNGFVEGTGCSREIKTNSSSRISVWHHVHAFIFIISARL